MDKLTRIRYLRKFNSVEVSVWNWHFQLGNGNGNGEAPFFSTRFFFEWCAISLWSWNIFLVQIHQYSFVRWYDWHFIILHMRMKMPNSKHLTANSRFVVLKIFHWEVCNYVMDDIKYLAQLNERKRNNKRDRWAKLNGNLELGRKINHNLSIAFDNWHCMFIIIGLYIQTT